MMFIKANADDNLREIQALKTLEDAIEKATKIRRKLADEMKAVDAYMGKLEQLKDAGCGADMPSNLLGEWIENELMNLLSVHRYASEAVYKTATEVVSTVHGFGYGVELTEAENYNFEHIGKGVFGIEAILDDGDIWVKTPMLDRRIPLRPRPGSADYKKEYSHIYCADIERAIRYLIGESLIDTTDFFHKKLDFIFVYGKNDRLPIDSDSHDTKAVIDSVAGFFGGDSAFVCSVSYASLRSDELESGTYIRLSKASKNVSSADSAARLLRIASRFSSPKNITNIPTDASM